MEFARSSVIYIAGAGHSGSSLLNLLLGNHPQIIDSGEVHRLSIDPDTRLCSCSKPISTCVYWTKVAELYAQLLNVEFGQFRWDQYPITVHLNGNRVFPLNDLALLAGNSTLLRMMGIVSQTCAEYYQTAVRSWQVNDALATAHDGQFIVDSTKNPRRLKSLYLIRPHQFRVIYLVRDGRAVAASTLRREGTPIATAAKDWKRSNEKVSLVLRTIPASKRFFLRYEDLCDSPQEQLKRVCQFIGIDYSEKMLQLGENIPQPHSIPGNPMLHKKLTHITKDERWRSELTSDQLAEFERVAGNLNQRLGCADR